MRDTMMKRPRSLSVRIYKRNVNVIKPTGSIRRMVSTGTAYRNAGLGKGASSGGTVLFCFGKRRLRVHVLDVEGLKRGLQEVVGAGGQQVLRMAGVRQRNWIVDVGVCAAGDALLSVWECQSDGSLKHRFGWEGEVGELQRALLRCVA